MAQPLATGDVLQVKIHTFCKGQWALNVRYYLVGDIGSATYTDQDFANALNTGIKTVYADLLPALAQYYGVSVQIVSPTAKIPVFKSDPTSGGYASTPAPLGTSYCIHLMTIYPGKGFRARFFVPFVPVGEVGDGITPTTGYVTKLTALGNVLRSTLVLTGGANNVNVIPIVANKPILSQKVITDIRLGRTFTLMESRLSTSDAGGVPFAPTP